MPGWTPRRWSGMWRRTSRGSAAWAAARPSRTSGGCSPNPPLRAGEDLVDHFQGLLDVRRIDTVVGYEADLASAHLAALDTAPVATGDERLGRHTVELEDDQVGLDARKVELDAVHLGQAFCEGSGICVVLRQPVDHVVEREETGGAEHADLAHPAAQHLPPAPGLRDLLGRPQENAPDRGAQTLGEAEGHGVGARGDLTRIGLGRDRGVEEAGPRGGGAEAISARFRGRGRGGAPRPGAPPAG